MLNFVNEQTLGIFGTVRFRPPLVGRKNHIAYHVFTGRLSLGFDNVHKPDIDNVSKLWLDALVSGGIIEDDKNVTELTVSKAYGESEKVSCSIYYAAEDEEALNG